MATGAKNFFLNERHELPRVERESGGSLLKLAAVDWAARAINLSNSLARVRQRVTRSTDPLRDSRFFFVARPEDSITKESVNQKKAPTGTFEERVNFSGEHNFTFGRLGLDLLSVQDDGVAVVHATPSAFERLEQLASQLGDLSRRDQGKLVALQSFESIPSRYKIDMAWLDSLGSSPTDAVIELQPLLTRVESDQVARAIAELSANEREGRIRGTGTDFSGRMWLRGQFSKRIVSKIVRQFFSVQSVHHPIFATAAAPARESRRTSPRDAKPVTVETRNLPVVGVVDTGVPHQHPVLEPFVRGRYLHPDSSGTSLGDHGSRVASRAVFGDVEIGNEHMLAPECRFLDIQVAESASQINDKIVVDALANVVANYPDVRVFNLSFDNRPLLKSEGVEAQEQRLLSQDLDNFVFARDVVVVVSAGNSDEGAVPTHAYPANYQDPDWGLGNWASTFNTLTCGSYSRGLFAGGLASHPGAPSPFCRTGPGAIAGAPVPDVAAEGGDCDATFSFRMGAGVQTCSRDGLWEDVPGSSFAAPVVANRCAQVIAELQQYCTQASRPYGVLVRAFISLAGVRDPLPAAFDELANRTLGDGRVNMTPLTTPPPDTAYLFWQGLLGSSKDRLQVQIPIPMAWIDGATKPFIEIVVAWDTPTNAAARDIYGCRNLDLKLRPAPDENAVRPKRTKGRRITKGYPILRRRYDLKKATQKLELNGDIWLCELQYDQVADYPPTLDFSPEQRVGMCIKLFDAEGGSSPQSLIQALPISRSMVHLSSTPTPIRTPVLVKSRTS